MFQTDFLSPYSIDQSKIVKIPQSQFFINIGLDIAVIIIAFVIWKYILWAPIQKLIIPDSATGGKYKIDKGTSIWKLYKLVKGILKEMVGKGDILINGYGFEYFTYIMFLRRLCLLMGIITITDVCIWIPYCLFYQPLSQFSLITMTSVGNNDFRTFYTIWIAFIVLYGMYDLKNYLFTMFMYRTFRKDDAIFNNLKTKTLHMQFLDNQFESIISIKAQVQQLLVEDMNQEDRILTVLAIPIQSELLQCQYNSEVVNLISEYGVNRLSCIWRFFKQQTEQSIRVKKQKNQQAIKDIIHQQQSRDHRIESCMIVVSKIETAEKLCQQFQIGKALCSICPDLGYTSGEALWKVQNSKMIVRWATDPKDLIWVNMGYHQKQLFNFILFNILCFILLLASFFFIAITSTDTYIKMPTIVGPIILITFNSTLRFLISKMVEFEKKTLRSEWEIKQFKMTVIYLLLNVILSSIVRDTLNLLGLLQTGWGWIELFSLVYKKSDGLFYYILIFNQITVNVFFSMTKIGDIILDCCEAELYYEKLTRIKRKPKYGKNDTFRLGYAYSIVFIILAVILLYSVSCPLIHLFGLLFFFSQMYVDTYIITVFQEEEICSNMRFIERVIQTVSVMIGCWIFLTATSLTFSNNYSNSIILYVFFGLVIYYAAALSKVDSFRDYQTDHIINSQNIKSQILKWKLAYRHPFNYEKYAQYRDYNSIHNNIQSKMIPQPRIIPSYSMNSMKSE